MTKADLFERLRYNVLAETLSNQQYNLLRKRLSEHHYAAGETILTDQSDGEELFLIATGRVKVIQRTRDGREHTLAILHAGDFFGELELVDGRPRMARVLALDECTVFSVLKKHFDELMNESHPFTFRLLQVLSVRLRTLNNHFVRELELARQNTLKELGKMERLIEASKTVNSTLELGSLRMSSSKPLSESSTGTGEPSTWWMSRNSNSGRACSRAKRTSRSGSQWARGSPAMSPRQATR